MSLESTISNYLSVMFPEQTSGSAGQRQAGSTIDRYNGSGQASETSTGPGPTKTTLQILDAQDDLESPFQIKLAAARGGEKDLPGICPYHPYHHGRRHEIVEMIGVMRAQGLTVSSWMGGTSNRKP